MHPCRAAGTSDEKALRLRAGATAASRSFDTALRTLDKRQNPDSAARPEGKPASKRPSAAAQKAPPPADSDPPAAPAPIQDIELFQPRDRHGKPIPDWRYEWMTMAQRRATYCYPRNPELEAVAIAEEEAMIAEQAATDAAQQAADPDAPPDAG